MTQPLTIREAFEKHYVSPELSKGTQATMRSAFRKWESLTGNPPIAEINNATAAQFREAAQAAELAPSTINTIWRQVRAVLRRVGPVTDGNPWAMELIPRVAAMRPIHEPFSRPRRLSMDELNRLYLAARWMKRPLRNCSNPGFWWQAVIVVAYLTGLRLSDLLKIRWQDINHREQTLFVRTHKTGVEADLPLPEIVMVHLDRLDKSDGPIFRMTQRKFFDGVRELREQSRVQFDGFHDIRRTAASEADRVRPGMGKVLLLHAPGNVTERSYLNALPELRETVEKMELPAAFRHGPKMVLRAIREAKQEVTFRPRDFAIPVHPPADVFQFAESGFSFAGIFHAASPKQMTLLQAFLKADGPAAQETLWKALFPPPMPLGSAQHARLPLVREISSLRQMLRRTLRLPPGMNPIVATQLHEARGRKLCKYELRLPPALWQEMAGI